MSVFAVVQWRGQALIKAWRFGQKMRQYFDYGDIRDAVHGQVELERQQVRTSSMSTMGGGVVGAKFDPCRCR